MLHNFNFIKHICCGWAIHVSTLRYSTANNLSYFGPHLFVMYQIRWRRWGKETWENAKTTEPWGKEQKHMARKLSGVRESDVILGYVLVVQWIAHREFITVGLHGRWATLWTTRFFFNLYLRSERHAERQGDMRERSHFTHNLLRDINRP